MRAPTVTVIKDSPTLYLLRAGGVYVGYVHRAAPDQRWEWEVMAFGPQRPHGFRLQRHRAIDAILGHWKRWFARLPS